MTDQNEAIIDGAIRWALEHLGSQDYPFLCYGFLEDAYELGNQIELDGKGSTAKEAADAYGALPGPPRKGSYVFYDCSGAFNGDFRNWGHIGLALGDGCVVHAWDGTVRIDTLDAIERLSLPGWTPPHYLGYAPPELILQGMKPKS